MALTPEQRPTADGGERLGTDPVHEIQSEGGLAEFWYLDDGDIPGKG